MSVIVPIYNVEPYLKQCVDSIRNQTVQEIEILLIDDGSPDGCPQQNYFIQIVTITYFVNRDTKDRGKTR